MRILIVSQYFWPEQFRINDLALALRDRGHEVNILTGIPNYPAGRFFPGYGLRSVGAGDYAGIPVFRVPLVPRGDGRAARLFLNYASFALCASVLALFRCRRRYQVLFVYQPSPVTVGLPAILVKFVTGAPIVFWVQDLWPDSIMAAGGVRSRWILSLVEKLVRFIYARCDRILVQSRAFIPRVIKQGGALANVRYFPNWAETVYSARADDRKIEMQSKEERKFRVLFAGNLGEAQSLGTLLNAADRLRTHTDIEWIVVGSGRRRSWFEQEIQKRNLTPNVTLLDSVSAEMMPRYMNVAKVLLVTLRPDPVLALTIPSKIQSYLAFGKPVVGAIDGEGAKIISESGAGRAVPAGDGDALAKAILELYSATPETRAEMGRRGRAYYERFFDRDRLIGELETWLLELTES